MWTWLSLRAPTHAPPPLQFGETALHDAAYSGHSTTVEVLLAAGGYPDGSHVHNYPSGSRYEGGWKGGRKHGQGTYTYAGGGKYVGEFVDDKRHGQGAYTCEPCVRACVRARVRLRPRLRLPLPLRLRGER